MAQPLGQSYQPGSRRQLPFARLDRNAALVSFFLLGIALAFALLSLATALPTSINTWVYTPGWMLTPVTGWSIGAAILVVALLAPQIRHAHVGLWDTGHTAAVQAGILFGLCTAAASILQVYLVTLGLRHFTTTQHWIPAACTLFTVVVIWAVLTVGRHPLGQTLDNPVQVTRVEISFAVMCGIIAMIVYALPIF